MEDDDRLLTDDEAATLVRRSRRTIQAWRSESLIRSFWLWDGALRREVWKTRAGSVVAADKVKRDAMMSGRRRARG